MLEGGKGSFNNVEYSLSKGETKSIDYKTNISLGYKIRINNDAKPYFFDLDILLGVKTYDFFDRMDYEKPYQGVFGGYILDSGYFLWNFSVSATYNYKLYKGLYAGLGIKPTVYLNQCLHNNVTFDIPITTRLGYDFRFMDVSLEYDYGLFKTVKQDGDYKGKINDWNMQVFIPF